jgi:F0F1-type ATP synthase assembly protein I
MEKMMKKSAVPTTSSADDEMKSQAEQAQYLRTMFLGMAMSMSWQLAIVIIIPIVGGYKLDEHLHTSPWWTLAGCAVAVLGMIGVLLRIVKAANERVSKLPEVKK